MTSSSGSALRPAIAAVAGVAWGVTLPIVAAALIDDRGGEWPSMAFVAAALLAAVSWWLHVRERRGRLGVGGRGAGWLLIGSVPLLGVAGFMWVLVAMAVLASAIAYGTALLVTQRHARRPKLELATGVALFATGSATALFAVNAGLPQTEAWWMPAHVMLAVGLAVATILSGLGAEPVSEAPPGTAPR